MEKLKKELLEMIEIFDFYQISEEKQKNIIVSGLYFEFNRNDSVRLNCFQVAKLLKLCKTIDNNFDANQMFRDLNNRRDNKYEYLVKYYLESENREENQKQLTLIY